MFSIGIIQKIWPKFSVHFLLLLTIFFILVAGGCAKRQLPVAVPGFEKMGIRLIAVLPVDNKTKELEAGKLLRETVANELFLRGYPRVPFQTIDEKISASSGNEVSPQSWGKIAGVDAVLYPVLKEVKTTYRFIQASTKVSVFFVLKSAKSGEILWSKEYGTSRS